MKPAVVAIFCCIVLSGAAWGVEIKPTNFSTPSPGGTFSFDFIALSPPTEDLRGIQLTLESVSGPGVMTFDVDASKTVYDDPSYWIYGINEGGAVKESAGSYIFPDNPDPAITLVAPLAPNDTIARFAFTWDGTVGDYVFTLNSDINYSYLILDSFNRVEVSLPDGAWFTEPIVSAEDNSFTVHIIPEPATVALLATGGLAAMRRRPR